MFEVLPSYCDTLSSNHQISNQATLWEINNANKRVIMKTKVLKNCGGRIQLKSS